MPLTIQPHCCSPRDHACKRGTADQIVVALVNNMPDSALQSTAAQFTTLLRAAAGHLPVQLRFCYLPEVARGPEALGHLEGTYWHIDEILQTSIDAVIVTGLEPKAPRLPDEPYWPRLAELLAWSERHTVSSIWSCLAAHAAVQLLDGIERRRLAEKRFGVYEHAVIPGHPMTNGVPAPLVTPHSRWNELPVDLLRGAGYTIVSSSPETGADLFVKRARSLLVFLQGHPEYGESTLLREYRRDVGRFLRGEQQSYPTLPRGYFSPEDASRLAAFRERALAAPSPALMDTFPIDARSGSLQSTWSASAVRIYRNWLSLIAAAKRPERVAVAS
jgi:homoserine O-succinyltransferase/O-acetyltransferase